MSVTSANIIPRKNAEATATVQYTVSSGITEIDKFTVTNVSAGTVTFSCWLPASSNSGDNTNLIVDNYLLGIGETYEVTELAGQILADGGKIVTLAGAGGALVISASGREIT